VTQSATDCSAATAAAWAETIIQTNDIHFFTDNLPSLSLAHAHVHMCERDIETRHYPISAERLQCLFYACTGFLAWRRMKNFYCNMKRRDFVVEIL
jgi:hypothetical protein